MFHQAHARRAAHWGAWGGEGAVDRPRQGLAGVAVQYYRWVLVTRSDVLSFIAFVALKEQYCYSL